MGESPFGERTLPGVDVASVQREVARHYGIDGDYHPLESERDLTWRVTDTAGRRVTVKVSNAADPEGVIDFQVKALEHLSDADPTLRVPRVVPTKDGSAFEWIEAADGAVHALRVLSWLEGTPMYEAAEQVSGDRLFDIGRLAGRLAMALRTFAHPHATRNEHLWDITRALDLRPLLAHVPDPAYRALLASLLDRAASHTLPMLRRTRWQVIHGDAHLGNVLSDPEGTLGVIDFGDMGWNPIVADLAQAADVLACPGIDPVEVICEVVAGYDSVYPLEPLELDLCFDAVLLQRVVGALVVATYRAAGHDWGGDPATQEQVIRSLVDIGREQAIRKIRDRVRAPVYSPVDAGDEVLAVDAAALFRVREGHLGPIWHFYDEAMHFTRAEGAWMFTADGTAYLDSYNNVPQVGHSHPHVVRAIARQAAALNTNTRYLTDVTTAYAERLTKDLPDHLDTCIFVNSGSEANDLALQIARALTSRHGALVIENAYHGCTWLSNELSPQVWNELPNPGQHAGIEQILNPDMYRGPHADAPDAAQRYAADADRAVAALAARGFEPAAFFVDSALCSNGISQPPPGWFNLVADRVHAAGGLVVADEVQAGLGRMGEFWGFAGAGLDPDKVDMITMGKPVGNAHPLGVIVLSGGMMRAFLNGMYPTLFSTFGGNTVACAAGMAVLDVIEREHLIEKANRVGDALRTGLRLLADKHALIGEVRGRGLLVGLDLVTDRATKEPAVGQTQALLEAMRRRRVLVGTGGPSVLKLRPSMAWDTDEVEFFLAALGESLAAVSSVR